MSKNQNPVERFDDLQRKLNAVMREHGALMSSMKGKIPTVKDTLHLKGLAQRAEYIKDEMNRIREVPFLGTWN